MGPEMPERGSKTSTVQVVWEIFEFFRRNPNDSLSRRDWWQLDETWLYHYIPETKQQSLSGGIAAHPTPKNSECKNPLENLSPRFFGIKTASCSFIISQRAKLSTRRITHFCWCNWRTFWKKTPRKVHQGGLVLVRQCPGSPGTCNPEETGLPRFPVSWSPTLFSGSGPFGQLPIPWAEKIIERSPIFVRSGSHRCSGDLVGWTAFWFFFLAGL